jgi:hypothetical protein
MRQRARWNAVDLPVSVGYRRSMQQAVGSSSARAKAAKHRIRNALMKVRQGGLSLKDIKNEDRPRICI